MLQVTRELAKPPLDPDTLVAAGKWMPAAELVKLLHNAETQSQLDLRRYGPSVSTARDVHDATVGCCMLSHLPPLRASCLRTMTVPAYQGPCQHPDCHRPSCEGNKLYIVSTSPLLMRMKFPHHKNESKWHKAVIEFYVPDELAQLLYMYLEGPRKALLEYPMLIEQTCDTVFMDKHGRAFDSSVFTTHFQNWMRSQGGPALNPTICRQIFVTERQSAEAVAGPSARGAAMVMGHSLRQWHEWYDIDFHTRLAQDAVTAMRRWRHALLQPADASDLEVVPVRKRCRFIIADSDSELDQHAQPQLGHANIAQLQSEPQPACPAQQQSAAHQTRPAQQQAQPESDSEFSEYMSCGSGSDSDIELVL